MAAKRLKESVEEGFGRVGGALRVLGFKKTGLWLRKGLQVCTMTLVSKRRKALSQRLCLG